MASERLRSHGRFDYSSQNSFALLDLILEIYSELNLAGADTLDRLAKPGKRNGACTEERVDRGSAHMVEEVKELCDHIQVTFAKPNSLNHTQVHVCRSLSQ